MTIEDVKICMDHEYCTYCPSREICTKRITFYNEEQFFKEVILATKRAGIILSKIGISNDMIALSDLFFTECMTKKRDREIQEHPIYSSI